MDIVFYLFLLMINQFLVFVFMVGMDYSYKSRNFKTIKCSKIVIRNTKIEKDRVSKRVFFFQIWNYIYISTYIILASIDVFAVESYILFAIYLYSLIAYSIFALLGICYAAGSAAFTMKK